MATVNTQTVNLAARMSLASAAPAVDDLVKQIQSDKADIRAKAWQYAYIAGAGAIKPLASLMVGGELEIGRAAARAIWEIVHHAGRPGADVERKSVVDELVALCGAADQPPAVRREVLWMLSELGGSEVVDTVAARLADAELREDARMVLERIPGDKSLAALKAALSAAPAEFKLNVAQSLRSRGVPVPGLPCAKLKPTKSTNVKPAGR